MNERAALLAAIGAAPRDDVPRLVYADWLDEYGDKADRDRAEFIRLQCRRALPETGEEERALLRARAHKLWEQRGESWRQELPRLPGFSWACFDRGFTVGAVVERFKQLREGAERAFAAAPITVLRLRSLNGEQAEQLARMSSLDRLELLDLSNTALGDQGVRALALCPHLQTLEVLHLNGHYPSSLPPRRSPLFTDRGGRALAHSPFLNRLKLLCLRHIRLGPAVAQALRERFGDAVHGLPDPAPA